jgi:hypothetical protein
VDDDGVARLGMKNLTLSNSSGELGISSPFVAARRLSSDLLTATLAASSIRSRTAMAVNSLRIFSIPPVSNERLRKKRLLLSE